MNKPPLTILLAAPRGFCAGVVRAVDIVERALTLYGAPVYVRHEIVHNRFVVDDLKAKGAIFVDELDEIPDASRPVVFSAHGVPKSVPAAATARLAQPCSVNWWVLKNFRLSPAPPADCSIPLSPASTPLSAPAVLFCPSKTIATVLLTSAMVRHFFCSAARFW